MPRPRQKPTDYHHRPTGQVDCRVSGQMIFLGKWDSSESRIRFTAELEKWSTRQSPGDLRLTLDDLALKSLQHAAEHYRKNGEPTSELSCVRIALRHVVSAAGSSRVIEFGPLAWNRVRQCMIDLGGCRKSINIHVGRIRRMFKWAAAEEFIPATVFHSLQTLSRLRAGRSKAKESIPVQPVSDDAIDAVRPYVSRQIWAMIQTQLPTSMRPASSSSCDVAI